jgi:hypothetical protein
VILPASLSIVEKLSPTSHSEPVAVHKYKVLAEPVTVPIFVKYIIKKKILFFDQKCFKPSKLSILICNVFFLTMHVVGQLRLPICDPFSPTLHHNLFLSVAALPLLQLFVEQHDIRVVRPPAIKVPGKQSSSSLPQE